MLARAITVHSHLLYIPRVLTACTQRNEWQISVARATYHCPGYQNPECPFLHPLCVHSACRACELGTTQNLVRLRPPAPHGRSAGGRNRAGFWPRSDNADIPQDSGVGYSSIRDRCRTAIGKNVTHSRTWERRVVYPCIFIYTTISIKV